MRLHSLELKNIGTFIEASLDFITPEDNVEKPPVVILTGENGTGKTLVLDAIRGVFGNTFMHNQNLERDIRRNTNNEDISISLSYQLAPKEELQTFRATQFIHDAWRNATHSISNIYSAPVNIKKNSSSIDWIVDYWTSKLAGDSFNIPNLISPKAEHFLEDSLSGVQKNIEVTQLICFFDYLRDSKSPQEKEAGEFLYQTLEKIIQFSLNGGELAYVSRTQLMPIIQQGGVEITLDKLSSGNLYLIQRMVSLLGKMYAVHQLNNTPVEEICQTRGLLLIDEAENHLHPKWQKSFINHILEVFPNLQIILTTHSPFIVSSVENARVYVCESQGDHSIVKDATEEYANQPIEEILLSEVFGGTSPFNEEIAQLLQQRKEAIKTNNKEEKEEIEKELLERNPQYFSYLEVDNLLKQMTQK